MSQSKQSAQGCKQPQGCNACKSEAQSKYKCASCGIINDSREGGSAPESCLKCEGKKFYRV